MPFMNYQSITPEIGQQYKKNYINQATYTLRSETESKMSSTKTNDHHRSLLVDCLVIFFGISSWVDINGLWVELPQMVQDLPENYSLASYIVVTTQLANLGPLVFSAVRRFYPQKVLEVPAIHITLAIGVISCALLAVFWHRTTNIGGEPHSTALLGLAFCLAFVDCTSSVLYLPFMANFKESYVISYLIGEGMSGLLPSLLALAQGVGRVECLNVTITDNTNATYDGYVTEFEIKKVMSPARFSVSVFFVILACMVVMSWVAFLLLNILTQAKSEKVGIVPVTSPPNPVIDDNFMISESQEKSTSSCSSPSTEFVLRKITKTARIKFYVLLLIQMYICFLHNVVLSLQTYSCLSYGNVPYHLAVVLSNMANPAFCFLAMFIVVKSLYIISSLTVFASGWAIYVLITAVYSPYPPLVNQSSGSVLVVLSWIMVVGVMAFTKASIAADLRRTGGQSYLYKCGVVTQIGSAIGAIVTFGLVQFTHIFKDYSPC